LAEPTETKNAGWMAGKPATTPRFSSAPLHGCDKQDMCTQRPVKLAVENSMAQRRPNLFLGEASLSLVSPSLAAA